MGQHRYHKHYCVHIEATSARRVERRRGLRRQLRLPRKEAVAEEVGSPSSDRCLLAVEALERHYAAIVSLGAFEQLRY
jgi:hypothetical protein